jgi:hypothetical protein
MAEEADGLVVPEGQLDIYEVLDLIAEDNSED